MESPADSEIRKIVTDRAFGSFVRASAQHIHPPPLANPYDLTTSLPQGISHKEIGIINLTAQFMAVYGIYFQRALIPIVIADPQFDFMTKPDDDNKHPFFRQLFIGFMAVLKPCQKLTENAYTEDVLAGFFTLLVQLEKQEEVYQGLEKMTVHICEFLANMGDLIIPFPPEHLSMMLQPFRAQINELILPPKLLDDDPLCTSVVEEIKVLRRGMIDAERSYWRSSVSYQAFYQHHRLTQELGNLTSTSLAKRGRVMSDDVNLVGKVMGDDGGICSTSMSVPSQQHTNQGGAQLHKLPPSISLPLPYKFASSIPEEITPMELGLIKLTAQFVAVYGMHFSDTLKKKVVHDHRFGFLTPADSIYHFYSQLCHGYLRVLLPSGKLCTTGAANGETLFEGFDSLVKKLEEGVDMTMVDLHAWEYFANIEDQELLLPAGFVSVMMNPVISQSAQVQVRSSDDHFPAEDPSPKRPKFDKPLLPPVPGSHTGRVSGPDGNDDQAP